MSPCGRIAGLDDVLDVAVGIAMVTLVGWHWAFLPAFLAELVKVGDLQLLEQDLDLLGTQAGDPQ